MAPNVSYVGFQGAGVTTNSLGMREREYEPRKPPGVTRVVLLGDSYVFDNGVLAEDRMGVFLEKWLVERASRNGEIECLHVGGESWNLYTGLNPKGEVSAYASLILATAGGTRLRVRGSRFVTPILSGASTEVLVETVPVGSFPLTGPESFEYELELPPRWPHGRTSTSGSSPAIGSTRGCTAAAWPRFGCARSASSTPDPDVEGDWAGSASRDAWVESERPRTRHTKKGAGWKTS